MALPSGWRADEAALYIETTPGNYAVLCGLENVSCEYSAEIQEQKYRDCATPHAAPVLIRKMGAVSCTISANGMLAKDREDDYYAIVTGGVARTFRLFLGNPVTTGTVHYTGSFVMSSYSLEADATAPNDITVSISLQSSGGVPTRGVV